VNKVWIWEVGSLNVRTYLPTGQGLATLQERIAKLHAELAIEQLMRLAIPTAQKFDLLQAVKDDISCDSSLCVGVVG
jgi:hypothetical protein